MFRATRLLTVLVTATLVSLAGCGSLPPPSSGAPAARATSPVASPATRQATRPAAYPQYDLARFWRNVFGNPWRGGSWSGFATDGKQGVVVKTPDIAENGAVVPVTVETVSRHGSRPRMTAVALYTCDRLRPVARYRYPRGVLQMQVRIKLRRTANIIAIATLDDGTVVRAMKQSKVTIGGCGGGGEPVAPETAPPPGPPEALYWQRSTLPVNTVRLSAEGDDLPIESYRADVRIDGFRARVVLDIVFRNNQRWARTGKFQLRLPPGSAPYYVAFGDTVLQDEGAALLSATLSDAIGLPDANLDFERAASNDALKEAVMVERQRANTAFWRTVYRNIDPALIEWNGSGIFSLDVFPLRYRQTHRIVLAYDMDLERGPRGRRVYRVATPRAVNDAALYVHLQDDTAATLVESPAAETEARVGDYRVRRYSLRQGQPLDFVFDTPPDTFLYQRGTETGDYFAAEVPLDLPLLGAKQAADTAVFAIDTSLSSRPEAFNEYVALTEAILERNSDRIARFAVLFFDVGTHWWQPLFVANTPANRRELRAALERLSLLGASDLSRAVQEVARPLDLAIGGHKHWDVFLMTDGRDNWGDPTLARMQQVLADSPVSHLNIYTSQPGESVARLRGLAESNRGAVYVLNHPRQVAAAARAHRQRAWRLTRIEAPGTTDVLVAGAQGDLLPNQLLRIAGRGVPRGELRFHFVAGERRVVVRHALRKGLSSALAPRAFGEMAVAYLEDTRRDSDAARFLAGHFRVPRATMSLLMLARDADYRRYGINRFRKYAAGARRVRLGQVIVAAPATQAMVPGIPLADNDFDALFGSPGVGGFIACDAWPVLFEIINSHAFSARRLSHEPLFLPDSAFGAVAMPTVDLRDGDAAAQAFMNMTAGEDDAYLALRVLASGVEVRPGDDDVSGEVVTRLLKAGFVDDAWWLAYRQLANFDSPGALINMARVLVAQERWEEAALFYELALAPRGYYDTPDTDRVEEYRDFLQDFVSHSRQPGKIRHRLARIEAYLEAVE